MRNRFDRQLERLNDEMIEMGSMIEAAIEKAVSALVTQDVEKAKAAIKADDEIDHQERDIENLCLKLLLQQQPVASDLRQISSALKMITDMERIGDHAADISEITIMMAGKPYIKKLEHIQEMAKETMQMLVNAVDAYVEKDMQKAQNVIKCDDVVDDLFNQVKTELIQLIHEDADAGEQAADLLMVAKYFERIGDHATNISEWVIFSITGTHVEDKEEQILSMQLMLSRIAHSLSNPFIRHVVFCMCAYALRNSHAEWIDGSAEHVGMGVTVPEGLRINGGDRKKEYAWFGRDLFFVVIIHKTSNEQVCVGIKINKSKVSLQRFYNSIV